MNREKRLKYHRKRWARVIRLRDKGLTFVEIGELMGISRQRASQMYYQGKSQAEKDEEHHRCE